MSTIELPDIGEMPEGHDWIWVAMPAPVVHLDADQRRDLTQRATRVLLEVVEAFVAEHPAP